VTIAAADLILQARLVEPMSSQTSYA